MLTRTRLSWLAPLLIVLACSRPEAQTPKETEALRKEIEALKAQVTAMQRDIDAIKTAVLGGRTTPGSAPAPPFANIALDVAGAPAMGSPSAQVTLVEVSDYHCPFCRRHFQQVFPQIDAEYIKTGKIRYVFADFPVSQLHPDAFRSHEAAACAGDQGKYWEMHAKLFTSPAARDYDALVSLGQSVGLDTGALKACLTGQKHAKKVQESVQRMEGAGIPGTPIFFIGKTPSGSAPVQTIKFVYGARPYADFKAALDDVLRSAGL